MDQDERDPQRTIQVDALSDVELLDGSGDAEVALEPREGMREPLVSRAPPPLPRRKPNVVLLGVVVLLTGALGALGAYYLIPTATPPSPPAPEPASPAPAAEEDIREVPMDEAFIIRFSEDAGLPPAE